MNDTHLRINFQLKTETAFHFGTGLATALADRAVARDATGYLILPASLLKGVIRDRLQKLCQVWNIPVCDSQYGHSSCRGENTCLVCRLFGNAAQGQKLNFSDGKLNEESQLPFRWDPTGQVLGQTQNRTQIQMSRLRRTAMEKHLFVSEYGHPGMVFESSIVGRIPTEKATLLGHCEAPAEVVLLLAALSLTDQLGSGKSRGCGRVTLEITELFIDHRPFDAVKIFSFLNDAVMDLNQRRANQ